ncbi:YkvI family membrane protein [Elongatibacter sediminis]|uniref:Membrane protein YkvI n=1 Tax=Elongatibacter sediminis TaxID=3119006 RepID=A0AAW9R8R8_9GAMM
MNKTHWFRIYVLPGLVFQSLVIGGGYATGRELVEFFLSLGPRQGLMAMLVTAVVWSLVTAASFEFARSTGSLDYRSFFKNLLGPFWVVFEMAYFVLMLLVLAVIAAASGAMLHQTFGIWPPAGTLLLMGSIGILTFFGSNVIENFMSGWSFLLYAVYATFLFWGLYEFSDGISAAFDTAHPDGNWAVAGVKYAGYNLAVIPAVLFCLRHTERRSQALISGGIAGLLAIVPGIFFYVVLVGFYPEILQDPIPVSTVLAAFGATWFGLVFQIVIFGTFVETGTGLLHAINERVERNLVELGRVMPRSARPAVALGALTLAIVLGNQLGLIKLIANGYGVLTWVFIATFVIPVLAWALKNLLIRNTVNPGDKGTR